MRQQLQVLKNQFSTLSPSYVLLLAVTALTLLGLVVLASASQSFRGDTLNIFNKQLIFLPIALLGTLFFAYIDIEKLRPYIPLVFVASILCLILVLVPGIGLKINGAKRWISLGPVRMQPSEFAKIALVFVLAQYFSTNSRSIKEFKVGFLFPSLLIGIFCALIILEPDFGTTFLCGLVGFSIMFLVGVRLRYLFPALASALLAFSVLVYLNPVRFARLTAFLDIESHKMDTAYQLWQGILSFVAGGTTGLGLGNGRQQMAFLPEAHTDFIFPIIGEELGLFFTFGVVSLFFLIFVSGFLILRRMQDTFYFVIVLGSLLCITLQALINVGVVTGLLPTKGMSLPFISYGGSNLIVMFCFVGILINALRSSNSNTIVKPTEL